jgi:predicted TPR repeat methyltransferase
MENGVDYSEEYFESGIASGVSLYENYRWIPELTIPMVMTLIDHLKITPREKILDYGCAKGYLVKAFRLLNRQAWGVDISTYAINNADPGIKKYCAVTKIDFSATILSNGCSLPIVYDLCISKDVLEHIPLGVLERVLTNIPALRMFVVVPLGDGEKYNIPAFHLDKTHIHAFPSDWWIHLFDICGWSVIESTTRINGIKDHWSKYKEGHGFFTLVNKGLGNTFV